MRTIKGRFERIKSEGEYLADFACLAEAVHYQKFSRRSIFENFIKLINPNDYNPRDTNKIVAYLHKLSNEPRSTDFWAKMPQKRRR